MNTILAQEELNRLRNGQPSQILTYGKHENYLQKIIAEYEEELCLCRTIVGAYGDGKTTLIQSLETHLLENNIPTASIALDTDKHFGKIRTVACQWLLNLRYKEKGITDLVLDACKTPLVGKSSWATIWEIAQNIEGPEQIAQFDEALRFWLQGASAGIKGNSRFLSFYQKGPAEGWRSENFQILWSDLHIALKTQGLKPIYFLDEAENMEYKPVSEREKVNMANALKELIDLAHHSYAGGLYHLFLGTTPSGKEQLVLRYPALRGRLDVPVGAESPSNTIWNLQPKIEEVHETTQAICDLYKKAYPERAEDIPTNLPDQEEIIELMEFTGNWRETIKGLTIWIDAALENKAENTNLLEKFLEHEEEKDAQNETNEGAISQYAGIPKEPGNLPKDVHTQDRILPKKRFFQALESLHNQGIEVTTKFLPGPTWVIGKEKVPCHFQKEINKIGIPEERIKNFRKTDISEAFRRRLQIQGAKTIRQARTILYQTAEWMKTIPTTEEADRLLIANIQCPNDTFPKEERNGTPMFIHGKWKSIRKALPDQSKVWTSNQRYEKEPVFETPQRGEPQAINLVNDEIKILENQIKRAESILKLSNPVDDNYYALEDKIQKLQKEIGQEKMKILLGTNPEAIPKEKLQGTSNLLDSLIENAKGWKKEGLKSLQKAIRAKLYPYERLESLTEDKREELKTKRLQLMGAQANATCDIERKEVEREIGQISHLLAFDQLQTLSRESAKPGTLRKEVLEANKALFDMVFDEDHEEHPVLVMPECEEEIEEQILELPEKTEELLGLKPDKEKIIKKSDDFL